MQFAVVFFPGADLTMEVVGPFRSEGRAEAVVERLAPILEPPNEDDPQPVPHVVRLISEAEAVRRFG